MTERLPQRQRQRSIHIHWELIQDILYALGYFVGYYCFRGYVSIYIRCCHYLLIQKVLNSMIDIIDKYTISC